MVKRERRRQVIGIEKFHISGIVACRRRSCRFCDKNRGYCVESRVSSGVGVTAELFEIGNIETGFFFYFPYRRILGAFTVIDKSAGYSSAEGQIPAFNQNYLSAYLNYYIDCRIWIFVTFGYMPAFGADHFLYHVEFRNLLTSFF